MQGQQQALRAGNVFSPARFSTSQLRLGNALMNRTSFSVRSFSAQKSYEMIKTEKRGRVGVVSLYRPKSLNALCEQLLGELNSALHSFDNDPEVGAIVITGDKKAFAAGADIKEMAPKSYMQVYTEKMFAQGEEIQNIRKPIIAAVNGYALGGGCELAMMCDIIIAGDKAQFGQPEITLGTIPGMGGTQRLIRAVGKSKAMELVLTGNRMDAKTAEQSGLVSRVVPEDDLLESAIETANKIASFSAPISMMAKDCVNKAYEMTLRESLNYEKRTFQSTFSTNDQKIGMKAFENKEKNPKWSHS